MRVHAPEPVRAGVVVLVPWPAGRLAVGSGLHVAAHGEDEALGSRGDLRDGLLEGLGVPSGGLAEAAHLAHVLARRGLDLAGRGGVMLVAKRSNRSAHAGSVPAVPQRSGRREL